MRIESTVVDGENKTWLNVSDINSMKSTTRIQRPGSRPNSPGQSSLANRICPLLDLPTKAGSQNMHPKQRNIFDFTPKERLQMIKEVSAAIEKRPSNGQSAKFVESDNTMNVIYFLIGICSALVFWILPRIYLTYIFPILFKQDLEEFGQLFFSNSNFTDINRVLAML